LQTWTPTSPQSPDFPASIGNWDGQRGRESFSGDDYDFCSPLDDPGSLECGGLTLLWLCLSFCPPSNGCRGKWETDAKESGAKPPHSKVVRFLFGVRRLDAALAVPFFLSARPTVAVQKES
jgi:hypothetical protein